VMGIFLILKPCKCPPLKSPRRRIMQRDESLTGSLQMNLYRQNPAKDPARKGCDTIFIPLKLGWQRCDGCIC
jgi:hypothetical protein